ncbi:chromosome alignment-maintaining phosphoprotein 1 [Bombina bombina]|uniref:chromosome alignment-maintaining phosphoprotein 1 n=1 Tax=Bombina bombina TaxID=8345 RepID=UPI00235AD049|nr:chromosome alignment-maintaining phosphoprotein 1 [Bombina bombina]
MEIMKKLNGQSLDCNHCNFHANSSESIQIHMGTIHPEYCDEMDTGGLGKLVFYQKSAKLFHCHRCFFTSKNFCNVYYHILAAHGAPEKWEAEEKKDIKVKSEEPASVINTERPHALETSEDEGSTNEQEEKVSEAIKPEENDTLTSWPEKVTNEDNQESFNSEFKVNSLGKASCASPEVKDKETSSEQELSQSSSNISKVSKQSSPQIKETLDFSDNEATSSHSKDIPEFSDDEDTPALLPGGLPHFSEDDEPVTKQKDHEESSEEVVRDESRGIEDISEDEDMPVEKKTTGDVSEDDVPGHPKESDSSDEDEISAPVKEIMDFSEEEDMPTLSKDTMEFSEEEEEPPTTVSKNIMEFSEEEETTNLSKNIMEFSDEEETPALSKDIMEFSEDEDDTPVMPKSIMEFSEDEDTSPQVKDMPKCLEGNSTPTQTKDSFDFTDDVDTSALKDSSVSDDEDSPFGPKDTEITHSENTPTRFKGVLPFSEDDATPSWSKDLKDDVSTSLQEALDASDDKEGFTKDEEIMKYVRRVKGRYYCTLCECRPLKKGPVLHHLITRHNLPSPFVCKTCGKTFIMETHLKHHYVSHNKGLYKCNRCSFQTDHPRGFKKHQTHCQRCHKDEDVSNPVWDFHDSNDEEN